MTDHTNLIARLRSFGGFANEMEITDEAAAALEALQVKCSMQKGLIDGFLEANKALQGEVEMWKATANAVVDFEKVELRAEVDRLTAEKQAAAMNYEARLTALEGQEQFKRLSDDQILWIAGSHGIDPYTCNPLAFYTDLLQTNPVAAGAAPTKEQT